MYLIIISIVLNACLFYTELSLSSPLPYPQSNFITSINFDSSTHMRKALGSDNWPVTWADDDHQYTSWGDGWGFAEDGYKKSLGFSRVEGPYNNYTTIDIWGDKPFALNDAQFNGKSYGIISIDGILYAWWGPGSNTTSYSQTRLLISSNHGATWDKSNWDLTDIDDRLIMPTICNFGRDYSQSRDNYVYHYFIRKQGSPSQLGVHKPGQIDLARVPKSSLMNLAGYEFFAGIDNNGNPKWTNDVSERVPVFEDQNGVGWNVSVSYNTGLDRYFLMTEHNTSFDGNLGIFDAPEPWGPWTTAGYYDNWLDTDRTFFWNFSNKWASSDGKNFVIVFTGVGEYDSWNTMQGNFVLSNNNQDQPHTPTQLRVEK